MKKLALILLLSVTTMGMIGCGDEPKDGATLETGVEQTKNDAKDEEETKEKAKVFKQGELAENENMKITINKVTTSKERNQFSDVKADRVVVISYTYENKTDKPLQIFSDYFQAYDSEGNALDSYEVIDHTFSKEISKGKKCTAEMVFALNSKDNNITLEMSETMLGGDIIATWNLNVK